MFGLGFGEMVILGVVLLVVVGPKELPKLLRAVGRGINKLRMMSTDLREQSGIDEIIHDESLREDIDALRSLSRGKVVDTLIDKAMKPPKRSKPRKAGEALPVELEGEPPDPEQEYPQVGCDAYGAVAEEPIYSEGEEEGEGEAEGDAEADGEGEGEGEAEGGAEANGEGEANAEGEGEGEAQGNAEAEGEGEGESESDDQTPAQDPPAADAEPDIAADADRDEPDADDAAGNKEAVANVDGSAKPQVREEAS